MEEQKIFNQITDVHLYEGCGNRLLIVHLRNEFLRSDAHLRKTLQRLGLSNKVDSVLVLTGDPRRSFIQGYDLAMDVFEPRGMDPQHPTLAGSWSTMCGNGIRAVTRYLVDRGDVAVRIKTQSGIRQIAVLPDNQFRVSMGLFTKSEKNLHKYIANFHYVSYIKHLQGLVPLEIWAGLNGSRNSRGVIDGEPHVMIFLRVQRNINMSALMRLAREYGQQITTNRDYFPKGINTNFVVIKERRKEIFSVLACTFERGVEYVTQACGTGATAIGSYLLSINTSLRAVNVHMPGGILTVERAPNNEFYLVGPASPI